MAILIVLSFALPIVHLTNADSILTSATFLFSVIYGFEISVVIGNFSALKTALAIETAGLTTIYKLADILGGESFRKIGENLENYILMAIDVPLADHLKTDPEFFKIFEPLKEISEVNGAQREQALQYLNEAIYYVPQSRNQVAEVAPRFVDNSVWVMLGFLATILVMVLFIGRDADLFSQLTAAVFSATVIGALMLLDEIDSNRIREAHLEYEMFNNTLKAIGKPGYYPEFAIKSGIINNPVRPYRVGIFPNPSSLDGRKIEVVN